MNTNARRVSKSNAHTGNKDHQHAHSDEQLHLFQIAFQMKGADLPSDFIVASVKCALEFDGVADLLRLWEEETDQKERDEIIADIQDMINACAQTGITEEAYVRFNDLDTIAKNIRAFKDSLLTEVVERGGISELAKLTGIPQPSLSRFFNTNTMPQRSTLLKIAKALNLEQVKIEKLWRK